MVKVRTAQGASSAGAAWSDAATTPRTPSTRTTSTWRRSWAQASIPKPRCSGSRKKRAGATGSPAFAAPARSGAAGWSGRLRWSSWRRAFSARWTCCCARGTTVGWKACRRRSAFAFEPTARRSSAPPRAAAMSISPKALPSPQASIPTMSPTSSQCATRAGLTSSDCWPSR